MSGEIHGIIPKEKALMMWRPYGERGDVEIDLSDISLRQAKLIIEGAHPKDLDLLDVWSTFYDFDLPEDIKQDFNEGLSHALSVGNVELIDMLASSHAKQVKDMELERERALNTYPDYLRRLSRAALKLTKNGFWRARHAEKFVENAFDPNGTPRFQYTPLTPLEEATLSIETDDEMGSQYLSDTTDFMLGIIRSVRRPGALKKKYTIHNRAHESVHALSGMEVYDITYTNGKRWPIATVIGHFGSLPSTDPSNGDDFSFSTDTEVSEGWTDYVAQTLLDADARLGKKLPADNSSYSKWSQDMHFLRQNHPDLFDLTSDVALLVDATQESPTQKRDAINQMHKQADKVLGMDKALETLLKSQGKSMAAEQAARKRREHTLS